MKRNDFQEIKGLSVKAIIEKIKTTKKELADLVLDKNMSKLKDLKSLSKKRKNIAQMMTVVRQKQLLEQLESGVKSLGSVKKEVKPTVKTTNKKLKTKEVNPSL